MQLLGVIGPDANPCVVRYQGQSLFFPPQVLSTVEHVQALDKDGFDPDAAGRQDLRQQRVYTIDSATASEVRRFPSSPPSTPLR